MGNEQAVKIDNGKGIVPDQAMRDRINGGENTLIKTAKGTFQEINNKGEVVTDNVTPEKKDFVPVKVYTKDDLIALRAKKVEKDKALRKVNKTLEKEQARAQDFTPEKVEALKEQAEKALQEEGARLQEEVDQGDKNVQAKQGEVTALQEATAKSIQDLETIQGISGLHRNSPKKLAPSPWSYAIPISIIGSMEALYPGQWATVLDNGKPYLYKSLRGQVWVDFSNFVTLKVTKGFGQRQVVYERNYSQGLTKWFRTLLDNIMPKAA